uniref:Taste receptor type 2 n=1 Tax=Microcebus murinus TaxID=30608 RepID=A0A8C5XNZ7_MICMU
MLTAGLGLLIAEFLIYLLGDGVLVVWIRRSKTTSYNLIVLGLAGCRFLLQWLIMLDLSLFSLFWSSHWLHYLNVFWVLVSQASLWFATFLSVFYCKKITTFEHSVYLWLKQRAYSLSLWCFLILLLIVQIGLKPYNFPQGNSSNLYPFSSWHCFYIFQFGAGNWLPFMVFLVSSGMLIVYLYRHHRKMKVHTAGRRDAQAKAHITALKSLGCSIILHLVYTMAMPFSVTSRFPPANLSSVFISEIFMAQTCQRLLWKTMCSWRSWCP